MRTLGVILAGGRSRRFGSDKAQALLGERTLLEHALAALRPHCDKLVIAGRCSTDAPTLDDWPEPALGPLGGLAAALHHALANGFDQVLSIPVDCIRLPGELPRLLEPAPAYLAGQPVIGLWPGSAAGAISRILLGGGSHSVRAFADAIGARAVGDIPLPPNVNAPADLARLEKQYGL